MDNRKFEHKLRKQTFLHRKNPFNAMMKNRLANTLSAPVNPKTLFTSTPLDQGSTEYCAENEACAEQTAVDNIVYDVNKFLAAVCQFLNIDPSQYNGVDMKTVMAASINPGLTPEGASAPTVQASAILWITPQHGMDLYDTIQAYITQYQRPVGFGVLWMNDWDSQSQGLVNDNYSSPLGGHCTMACGKVKSGEFNGIAFPEADRMVNQNSWGAQAPGSINGYYLFPREVVNAHWGEYGAAIKIFSTDRTVIILGKLSMLYVRLIDLMSAMGGGLKKK